MVLSFDDKYRSMRKNTNYKFTESTIQLDLIIVPILVLTVKSIASTSTDSDIDK